LFSCSADKRFGVDIVAPQPEQLLQTFSALIKGHDDLVNRSLQATKEKMQRDLLALTALLDGFLEARSAWETKQVALASDFNLLQVMAVEDDEATHSRILAWLLDRRLEHGSHAQGALGFRLFLREFGPDLNVKLKPQIMSYPDEPYWVRREVAGRESRVDIEIAASRKFIIHIENKIGSSEGEYQTHREWCDLKRRAKDLCIPRSNVHGIFLTLDSSPPRNKHFAAIGWHRLVTVLEQFAEEAQPPEVKLFAAHCARAVRKLTQSEPRTEERKDGDSSV